MDSIRFNLFQHLILVVIFINSSTNFLIDEEVIRQCESSSKSDPISRIRARLDLFLKIKRLNIVYLIWLVLDLCLAIYSFFNAMTYGIGSVSFISLMEQHNLITDRFIDYKCSRTLNRVMAILLFETYVIRIIDISRLMSWKNRYKHNNLISATATYFDCLKLTLRAWLFILGFTDKVQSRDKVHQEKIKRLAHLNRCHIDIAPLTPHKLNSVSQGNIRGLSHDQSIKPQDHSGMKRKYPTFNQDHHYIKTEIMYTFSNDSKNAIYEEQLFNFDNDFHEINYQLTFPKELLKTGTPHKLDLNTLKIITYLGTGSTVLAFSCIFILVRLTLLTELESCHNSLMIFFTRRLSTYSFFLITITNIGFQMTDVVKFVLDCTACYNKAKYTMNFTTKLSQLYCIQRNYISAKSTKIRSVVNIKSQHSKDAFYLTDSMIVRENSNLIYLSKKVDKLTRMIIELRSDLDQLKQFFTIYMHLELLCKIPCVMLTVATLTRYADLEDFQLHLVYIIFAGFWLPIVSASLNAALIHAKVVYTRHISFHLKLNLSTI